MGSSSKRARKGKEIDDYTEDWSDMESDEMVQEEVEEYDSEDSGNEDEDSDEQEEEEEDEDKEDYDSENGGNEEEDSAEEEEEVSGANGQNNRDGEMEELEKEYMNLRHQEQDILKNLKRHKDEDILKGKAVKNQKALWDKTLEFRFLLQKTFSSSNRLPQEPVRSSFCSSDDGVNVAYSDLITSSKKTLDSLLELQEVLIEKNPSVVQSHDGKDSSKVSAKKHSNDHGNLDAEDDDEWLRVSQTHRRIAAFRDKSIDKWQRKTQVTTGAAAFKGKMHAFNQNISHQVASLMRDPSRIIKQMQQRRSTVGMFGAIYEEVGNSKEDAHPDGDPELLDDAEFYQQLLKEFFENIDPSSSETAFYAMKKLQPKKRKIVDRRASKSRKIRYNVHEKIVNFMAPEPMDIPPMAPKLFENLFGLKYKKTAT